MYIKDTQKLTQYISSFESKQAMAARYPSDELCGVDKMESQCLDKTMENKQQSGIRRRKLDRIQPVVQQNKRIKLSDFKAPQYPISVREQQHYPFEYTPVTNKIALADERIVIKWDSECRISEKEFSRRKHILAKCMKIMFSENIGYVYGSEVTAQMKGFLRQCWTELPTMTTHDKMPILERDTVIAILEMVEKNLIDNPKDDCGKLFKKLLDTCQHHFVQRRRAGIHRYWSCLNMHDQEIQVNIDQVNSTQDNTQEVADTVINQECEGMGNLVQKFDKLTTCTKDAQTQLDFLIGDGMGKLRNICEVPGQVRECTRQPDQTSVAQTSSNTGYNHREMNRLYIGDIDSSPPYNDSNSDVEIIFPPDLDLGYDDSN